MDWDLSMLILGLSVSEMHMCQESPISRIKDYLIMTYHFSQITPYLHKLEPALLFLKQS